MKRLAPFALVFGFLLVVGCNAEPTHVEGQEKKDMENWLKHGIPASQSPGGAGKGTTTTPTPSGVPTDK